MMTVFQKALLSALVEKSHDLMRDDILMAVFNMYSNDADRFYSVILSDFVQSYSNLPTQCHQDIVAYLRPVQDAPSFTEQMGRLVDDIAFYRKQ